MRRMNLLSFIVLVAAIALFGYSFSQRVGSEDNMAPIIRMDESTIEVSINDGEDVLLEGVTATDVKDGDVTDSVIVESISDFLEDGRRIVTLAAFDSENHVGMATRQITYSDYVSPRFTLSAPLQYSMGTTSFMDNIGATDDMDGDISSSVQFSTGFEMNASIEGDYAMQLEVTNSAGDTAYLPVTVSIYDSVNYNQTPQFLLTEYIKYVKVGENIQLSDYLTGMELGGVEYQVVPTGGLTGTTIGMDSISMSDAWVDYNTPGTYEATYSYTAEAGVTGTTRMIVVVEE